jgi:outer membrane cobalamin receptor
LRLGIENGPWFFNIGDSFRKPNLYEINGDGFVSGNPDLLPEDGIGYELGYGAISIFRYEFEESIEYVPGYNTDFTTTTIELDADETFNQIGTDDQAPDPTYVSCVLDTNWNDNDEATFGVPGCIYKTVSTVNQVYTAPTYSNTGEYVTQGIRYNNVFGPVTVNLKWTDTEQPRVPEYAGAVILNQNFKGVDFRVRYAVNLNRKPGEWDFVEDEYLEDLERLDINITKRFANGVTLSLNVENLTDEVVEVVPFYNSTQRETTLVIDYKW